MALKSHQEGARPQQIGCCFDIRRSTLFRWKQAKPDWTISAIQAEITRLFLESGETYGSRRLSVALCQIG
ncbi:hypothetical protein [Aggregatibacter actinomycetemcomitans]|uniref:hypothetical protein n=1 Tax=Aggregatibacter actinomycetemcomitans TaxID=714 RepID=UPI0011DC74F2|nr:hypothetical protein [Aggregatibacter actinomycetemcomitans]QEH48458.1 hypothetical protein FXN57_01215 [Aggregatibacter actinomycetemcomitans]